MLLPYVFYWHLKHSHCYSCNSLSPSLPILPRKMPAFARDVCPSCLGEKYRVMDNSARVNSCVIVFLATAHFASSKQWSFAIASTFPGHYFTPEKNSRIIYYKNLYFLKQNPVNWLVLSNMLTRILKMYSVTYLHSAHIYNVVVCLCNECRWLWSGDQKGTDSKWALELLFLSPRSMKVRWTSTITCAFAAEWKNKELVCPLKYYIFIQCSST